MVFAYSPRSLYGVILNGGHNYNSEVYWERPRITITRIPIKTIPYKTTPLPIRTIPRKKTEEHIRSKESRITIIIEGSKAENKEKINIRVSSKDIPLLNRFRKK